MKLKRYDEALRSFFFFLQQKILIFNNYNSYPQNNSVLENKRVLQSTSVKNSNFAKLLYSGDRGTGKSILEK